MCGVVSMEHGLFVFCEVSCAYGLGVEGASRECSKLLSCHARDSEKKSRRKDVVWYDMQKRLNGYKKDEF